MAFTKNDEAVSPVIGVILMVAITVILAAVIAAFVFGMAGNVQKTKVVQLSATKNATGYITVTNMGGSDIATLQSVNVTVAGADMQFAGNGPVTIGSTAGVQGASGTAQRVMLVGHFTDGATQILLDVTI
jgi:archaeal type IV pilus assembly protein PilA